MSITYSERAVLDIEATGSLIEAAGGVAVIVLAIIGLARGDVGFLTSIAGIVLGASLLAQGGAIAAEYSKLLTLVTGGAVGSVELGGGMSVEVLAGASVIILGILGLIGLSPEVLLPAAVIAVGSALVLAASGFQRLNTLKAQAAGLSEVGLKVAGGALSGAIAAQVMAGAAAVVLGILALTIVAHAAALTLVGLLVLGVSVVISGTALTGRLLRLFNIKHA